MCNDRRGGYLAVEGSEEARRAGERLGAQALGGRRREHVGRSVGKSDRKE